MNRFFGFAAVVARMAGAFGHFWSGEGIGKLLAERLDVASPEAAGDMFEVDNLEHPALHTGWEMTSPNLRTAAKEGIKSAHETGNRRYSWEIRSTEAGARIEVAVQRPAGVAGRFHAEFDNRGTMLRWWIRPGDEGVVVEERHAEMLSWVAQDAAGEAIQSEVFAAAKNLVTTAPPSGWEEIGEEIEQRLAA